MRFKATLSSPERFRNICIALSSLRPTSIIKATSNGIQFISVAETGTRLFSTMIPKDALFDEYTATRLQNETEICFQINVELMAKALYKVDNLEPVRIKLTKRDRMPYLSINFQVHHQQGNNNNKSIMNFNSNEALRPSEVWQEINAELMKDSQMVNLKEPSSMSRKIDVFVSLPEPKSSVVRISERYKRMSSRMVLKASKQGILSIEAKGDAVKLESTWKQVEVLENEESQQREGEDDDDHEEYSVCIDSKAWMDVLKVVEMSTKIVLAICHEHMLIVQCHLFDALPSSQQEENNVYLMYYMPHHEL